MKTFIKNPLARRRWSLGLLATGAALIFLAPEGALIGWVPLLLGIGLEFVGIALAHRDET